MSSLHFFGREGKCERAIQKILRTMKRCMQQIAVVRPLDWFVRLAAPLLFLPFFHPAPPFVSTYLLSAIQAKRLNKKPFVHIRFGGKEPFFSCSCFL